MSEQKRSWRFYALIAVTIAFFGFQMYLALVKQLTPMLQSPLHLVLALAVIFLVYPTDRKYRDNLKRKTELNGTSLTDDLLNKFKWTRFSMDPEIDHLSF